MSELADELREHIFITYGNYPPAQRRHAQWVMDPEWLTELNQIGPPPSAAQADTLMGLPIEERPGAGPPHLEPQPRA